jgi:hypothetical protein
LPLMRAHTDFVNTSKQADRSTHSIIDYDLATGRVVVTSDRPKGGSEPTDLHATRRPSTMRSGVLETVSIAHERMPSGEMGRATLEPDL